MLGREGPVEPSIAKAIAVLRDEINTALKDAMKARDERRVSALRLINAAIQNAEIEAQMRGRESLAQEELLALLQKMIKQRQESAEIYDKAGRTELGDKERGEIAIISAYLPQQMSEMDVKAAIAEAARQVGAQGIKDMGKVMAALKQAHAGRMDFGEASALVKSMLAGS
jgi:uncharacterized protein YqeY